MTKQKKSSESRELIPDVETQLPSIEFNFDEVKDKLEQKLEVYEKFEVTESNLSEAKKERANLNKISKAINRMRIDIKKELNKPVDKFEDKMKVLSGMVDDVVEEIDEDIDEFDERRRQEQIEKAKDIIDEQVKASDLPDEYLEKIEFKDFYSNLSATNKSIKEDVDKQLEALKQEYEAEKAIRSAVKNASEELDGDMYADGYVETFRKTDKSLSDILNIIQEKKTELLEKEKDEEKEETIPQDEEEPQEKEGEQNPEPEVEEEETEDDEMMISATLEVEGTSEQLKRLKEYMEKVGIEFNLTLDK